MKPLTTIFRKRILPLTLCSCLISGAFVGCGKKDQVSFADFTQDLFVSEITANTINLNYTIDDPAAYGISDYEISLGDFSKEARVSSKDSLQETKDALLEYEDSDLTLEEQLTYDLLVDYLDTQIALCDYDLFSEPLAFSGGLQMELPILYAEYKLENTQDIEDYLELISLTDEYFDQVMEFEQEKSDNGYFMSEELCVKVIESCEAFLENPENHYLLTTFENRLDKLDLTEQQKSSYIRQNAEILEKELFPAYENMITKLEELKGTGTNDGGVCNFENGKEYYELLVYAETGCDDSIDELYERIENQCMDDLMTCSLLYSKDPSITTKSSNLKWSFESPDSALVSLQDKILEDFPEPPETTYEINYIDPALEEFLSPAFYIVAPVDNYTENVIYINNGYVSSDIYAFTTLAHEGYPGHLYQTVMTYTYDYPDVRSILNYSGYVEGWATYVEMLSYEYADVNRSIASFLSHNQAATLSLYAASDIGIHYYGWSEEDMLDFWSGYGITDEEVIKEITQLILSEPGNYLKYYVGYIEFLELREYAEDTFEDDYSDLEFHRAILDIGPAPFHIIEEYLDEFYSPQT
ncbi:MAG: DUF885 domain-containing protein [Agathobacter sp.]|nr:DUF885 domain-containing protein [Agathobacter sp.]